jgi:hypothetical protein
VWKGIVFQFCERVYWDPTGLNKQPPNPGNLCSHIYLDINAFAYIQTHFWDGIFRNKEAPNPGNL